MNDFIDINDTSLSDFNDRQLGLIANKNLGLKGEVTYNYLSTWVKNIAEFTQDDQWRRLAGTWSEFCDNWIKAPEDTVELLLTAAKYLADDGADFDEDAAVADLEEQQIEQEIEDAAIDADIAAGGADDA